MGARMLLNLGLVAAALVLAMVLWIDSRTGESIAPRLTELAPGEIHALLIDRPGNDGIRIERDGDDWRMRSPVDAPANGFRIEPLLRVVEAMSHARFPAAADELARYGLDAPRATLRVDGVEIAFGDTEPLDQRRYVLTGDLIHLTDDHYLHRLQSDYPAFLSNRLLPEGARPVRLELPGLTIARDTQGRWALDPPREVAADAVNRFVDAWRDARAILVDRYAGDAAQESIRVTLADAEPPLEFLVVESEVELALALPALGVVYHLGSEQGGRLLDPAPEGAGTTGGEP